METDFMSSQTFKIHHDYLNSYQAKCTYKDIPSFNFHNNHENWRVLSPLYGWRNWGTEEKRHEPPGQVLVFLRTWLSANISLLGFDFLVCGQQLTLVDTALCRAQLSGEYETTFNKQANWIYSMGLSVPGLCSASTCSSGINPVGFNWTHFTLPRPDLLSPWFFGRRAGSVATPFVIPCWRKLVKMHFPGGPVAKTPHSQSRAPGFDPQSGN